tara:strand:+ start:729 stop:1175 length:447 start_codon:yes stop_codon:yes gene_type:complete
VKKIIFFNDYPFLSLKQADLLDWIHDCVHEKGSKIKRIDINFITEHKMLDLNKKHLKHDNHTDILTFSYNDHLTIESEIFICFERALENAKKWSVTTEDEILRLISHGLLHLLGMRDNTQKLKEMMTKEEDNFITKFHVKHSKVEKIL